MFHLCPTRVGGWWLESDSSDNPTSQESATRSSDKFRVAYYSARTSFRFPQPPFWTVRVQLACPGIFANSIDRLARAFAVEAFCGLENV
jgi:hypothetical protein